MATSPIPYRLSNERAKLSPPCGKPLVVHVVVNVENWQFDRDMPRHILPPPHGVGRIPDVPNFSWLEYGMRCGMPRILRLLQEHRLPASVSFNAGVIDHYPSCAEAILSAGWEFIGHGMHQRSLQSAPDEGALITEALEKIERFTGTRPRGWLGPGLQETLNTLDLLKLAGIEYVCDWVLDDLPCWITTRNGPLIAMPYTLEINDSVLYAVERQPSDEIYRRFESTLNVFSEEVKTQPRILTLGLHPHLIGVPHRIGYLARMLDTLLERGDTIFMSGSDIATWFKEVEPMPAESRQE